MQSYVCVLRAYGYRRRLAQDVFDPVLACLERAVRRDADYSDAWAMLGWAYLDAGRYGYGNDADPATYYARATEAASRSLDLEPTSILGLKALSAINFFQGNYGEGERLARLALEQNPYDPDSLIQVGWRLAIRGQFDEGTPLVERAIARSVNPPAWYYHPLAIHYLMTGDAAAMLEVAEHGTADGSARGQALLAMAHGLSGNKEAGMDALIRMEEITPGYDPLERFRGFHATEEILEAMARALHSSGWPDTR
jgi:tetratricopeptide (TPR) repeat protein